MSAEARVDRHERADRRRGWLTLVAVVAIATVLFALVFLAPIAYWFLTGEDPLEGLD